MSKGFCLLAQNNSKTNYIRQAYALALSLHLYNKGQKISLITNDKVPTEWQGVFDQIVPIPWDDNAEDSDWKIQNRWKVYHASPYDETIVLEADMLITSDITHWWKELSKRELFFVSNVRTYRDEVVTSRFYRKTFDANELPNLYSALHYFKKGDTAKEFYNLLEIIVNNWALFYSKYAPNEYQKWCSIDVSMAIASKILGNEHDVTDPNSFITFTHMKPLVQGWYNKPEKWTRVTGKYFTEGKLFLGNYLQNRVLHYVEDEFLTDELLEKIENGTTLLP
jgi:hypothetical protein|tara:strand:- start:1596 stop:2435 length:840 start_codon:yes stop_codon:yes gene_type:complete